MFVYNEDPATYVWVANEDKGWKAILLYGMIALVLPNTSRCLAYFSQHSTDNNIKSLWRPGIITGVLTLVIFSLQSKNSQRLVSFYTFNFKFGDSTWALKVLF